MQVGAEFEQPQPQPEVGVPAKLLGPWSGLALAPSNEWAMGMASRPNLE